MNDQLTASFVQYLTRLLESLQNVPHAPMFVTTTIAVVYWTVFVQGITIKPLVKFLNVKTANEKDPTMNERIAGRFMDHVVAGMEGILGELGNLRSVLVGLYYKANNITYIGLLVCQMGYELMQGLMI